MVAVRLWGGMTRTQGDSETGDPDDVFRALADERRRRVLDVLADRDEPVDVATLAAAVREAAGEEPAPDPERLRIDLAHHQIPVLAEAGLVDWDVDEGTVAATDHPVLSDERFPSLLGPGADDADEVFTALSSRHRRAVLAVLGSEGTASRDELARAVSERVPDGSREDSAAVAASLHHTHLPKLAAAGLVDYDAATGTVRLTGRSTLEALFGADEGDVADRAEDFLGGLCRAFRRTTPEGPRGADHPVSWFDPHLG